MDLKRIETTQLIRLKWIGLLLLVFSFLSLGAALLPITPEEEMTQEAFFPELYEMPPMNLYGASAVFVLVGMSCLLIVWHKRRGLGQ